MTEEHLSKAHSAEAAALGFYYQAFFALLALIAQDTDNAAVGIEQLDDVDLKADGHNLLYQLKHSISAAPPPIIKAIDYCLGSGKCELPAHVRRRSVAVGVKWTSGDAEMIIGRIVPPVGQATSTQMFASSGKNLPLPATVADFEGATTLEAGKAFIERVFGIGDTAGESDGPGASRGRATVRFVNRTYLSPRR